jgi:hypothetical protein
MGLKLSLVLVTCNEGEKLYWSMNQTFARMQWICRTGEQTMQHKRDSMML